MKNQDDRIFLDNAIEADVLGSVLKEVKIPYSIRSYGDLVYDGIYQLQKGWGHVEVPGEHEDTVRRLLAEVRKSHTGNQSG